MIQLFKDAFGREPEGSERVTLEVWWKKYAKADLDYAFRQASHYGKLDLDYIFKILKRVEGRA